MCVRLHTTHRLRLQQPLACERVSFLQTPATHACQTCMASTKRDTAEQSVCTQRGSMQGCAVASMCSCVNNAGSAADAAGHTIPAANTHARRQTDRHGHRTCHSRYPMSCRCISMCRAVAMCDGTTVRSNSQHCESGSTSRREVAQLCQRLLVPIEPGWSAGTMTAWRSRRICHASAAYASSTAISACARWLAALTGTTKSGSAWNANAPSGTCTQTHPPHQRMSHSTAAERRPAKCPEGHAYRLRAALACRPALGSFLRRDTASGATPPSAA